MYYCSDCGTKFDESEQTSHEHDEGICPFCGGQDITELDTDN